MYCSTWNILTIVKAVRMVRLCLRQSGYLSTPRQGLWFDLPPGRTKRTHAVLLIWADIFKCLELGKEMSLFLVLDGIIEARR